MLYLFSALVALWLTGEVINVILSLRLEKLVAKTKEEFAAALQQFFGRVDNVLADMKKLIDAGAPAEDFQDLFDSLTAERAKVDAADPDNTNNGDVAAQSDADSGEPTPGGH